MLLPNPITPMQMRAVELWVRGGCKSRRRALLEAGYSKSIAAHPRKVFESASVLDELAKRGLNTYGMRGRMSWENEYEDVTHEPTPEPLVIDFSKIPKEDILALKRKLAELPEPQPLQLSASPRQRTFDEEGKDMFGETLDCARNRPPSFPSFSSM